MTCTDLDQMRQSAFFASVNHKLTLGAVPPAVRDNPAILGQRVHDVIGGLCVYLMACPEVSGGVTHIKIGLARKVRQRVSTINSSCPLQIRKVMYFCTPGYARARALEQHMHQSFDGLRGSGEWFRIDDRDDLERAVSDMMDCATNFLADDFNYWVYDPSQEGAPGLADVETFLRMVWCLTTERFSDNEIEADLVRLTNTSASGFESMQQALSYGYSARIRRRY